MVIALGTKNTKTRKRFNTLEKDCKNIHNNKYSYTKSVFVNMKTKFIVTCSAHGDFNISPDKHVSRKQGCPVCGNKKLGDLKRKSFAWFENKASTVHKNKYEYLENSYKDTRSQVEIICPIHDKFAQKADNHLQGRGCLLCGKEATRAKLVKTAKEFILEATNVHGTKYDYSKVQYVNTHTTVEIICKTCNNLFKQTPNNHLLGRNCNNCFNYKFDKEAPAILYYILIDNTYYKIGITNFTLDKRFPPAELKRIQPLKIIEFTKGEYAYKAEQAILQMYEESRITVPNLLRSGNTELFDKNILKDI